MIMTMIMMIIRCVPHTLIMKMIIRCVHLDSPCVHQVCPPHLDGLPLFLLHRQRHVLGGIALHYISLLSDGGLSKDIIVIISMVT